MVGIGVGVHGGATGVGASAVRSSSAPKAATPAGPSAMAWCSFKNTPTRRSGRPGSSHSSHSGRAGSSASPRQLLRRPAAAAPGRPARPAGGLGRGRRGRSEAASTHSGQPSPRRGRYSSCRKRGTRCSLGSRWRRTASIRTRPSPSSRRVPSRMASPPMSLDQPKSSHSSRNRSDAVRRSRGVRP